MLDLLIASGRSVPAGAQYEGRHKTTQVFFFWHTAADATWKMGKPIGTL